MFALSVSISTSSSPTATSSPSDLSHFRIVPSSMESDRRGIATSAMPARMAAIGMEPSDIVSGTDRSQLAEEKAALRPVAGPLAQNGPASELFRAVAREVGTLLGADYSGLIRYEDDGTVAPLATWAAVGEHPPRARALDHRGGRPDDDDRRDGRARARRGLDGGAGADRGVRARRARRAGVGRQPDR